MKRACTSALILLFVFFFVLIGRAGPLEISWRAGQLILWNDSVINGELAYNWSAEVIMLRRANGGIHTLSAHRVREFGWFDADQSKHRHFVSLTSPIGQDRASQGFYEVCLDGSLPVIRRLRRPHGVFKGVLTHPTRYADTRELDQHPDQFEYFVYDDGQFRALDRFYPAIYAPRLARYDRELQQFAHVHNINERSLLGRLVLIDQYNIIARKNQQTASARTTGGRSE